MKKILLIFFTTISVFCQAHEDGNFISSDILKNMEANDKIALLMVHFGTTYDETRTLTIDAINNKVKEAYPDIEVREAYTSRIVVRRLKERNILKDDPITALFRLKADGYTHVIIQSSNIIEGVEMESLRRDADSVEPFFKEIRIGRPLLYSTNDFEKVTDILIKQYEQKEDVVFVGHGTCTPITASYAMLDYMFKSKEYANFHVGTVEGYPSFDNILQVLKARKAKKVNLVPLMFVAGDHAKNDIAGHWTKNLEKSGYQVTSVLKGLGEYPEIQDIFIEHIQFIMHHKEQSIVSKKKKYAAGADVE